MSTVWSPFFASRATRVLLVRHAHTRSNDPSGAAVMSGRADVPLSDRGIAQADQLRRWFASERKRVQAVYTSPLARTHATAARMLVGSTLVPTVDPALQEIDCGEVDGLPIHTVERTWPSSWAANLRQCDDDFRWPGGESYRELRERAVAAVSRLAEAHQGGTVLLVTHTGFISQVVGAQEGVPPARWESCRPGNASITELLWHGAHGRIVRFDDRAHLADGQDQNASARRMTLPHP